MDTKVKNFIQDSLALEDCTIMVVLADSVHEYIGRKNRHDLKAYLTQLRKTGRAKAFVHIAEDVYKDFESQEIRYMERSEK